MIFGGNFIIYLKYNNMVSCPEETAFFLSRQSNPSHQVQDISEYGAVIWNIWVPCSTKYAVLKKAKVSAKSIMQI